MSGLISVYPGSDCGGSDIIQISIGADGYVYTADGSIRAVALCAAAHNDGTTYTSQQQAFNNDVWQCAIPPTDTPVPTATDTSVPPTDTSVPPTETPVPTATDTSAPVNSRAVVGVDPVSNSPGKLAVSWNAPSETPADYRIVWAPIDENFKNWTDLSGNAFPTSPSYTITGLDHGVAYKVRVRARYNGSAGPWTDPVQTLAMDAVIGEVVQQQQQEVVNPPTDTPAATDTLVPPSETPIPTNTPVPPTNTPVPPTNTPVPPTATDTPVPANAKVVSNVTLQSNQAGVLEVSWDAPLAAPKDYRISWSLIGEKFPTWTDLSGNAFPTSPSYTISGLDEGVRYKVRLRARYESGGPGDWTGVFEADVAGSG